MNDKKACERLNRACLSIAFSLSLIHQHPWRQLLVWKSQVVILQHVQGRKKVRWWQRQGLGKVWQPPSDDKDSASDGSASSDDQSKKYAPSSDNTSQNECLKISINVLRSLQITLSSIRLAYESVAYMLSLWVSNLRNTPRTPVNALNTEPLRSLAMIAT